MDTKSALLAKCKFFKGEKECPENAFFFGWECEEMYVDHMAIDDKAYFKSAVDFYCKLGLDQVSELNDETPIEVKALLFERYCHNSDTDPALLAGSFPNYFIRQWYKKDL